MPSADHERSGVRATVALIAIQRQIVTLFDMGVAEVLSVPSPGLPRVIVHPGQRLVIVTLSKAMPVHAAPCSTGVGSAPPTRHAIALIDQDRRSDGGTRYFV